MESQAREEYNKPLIYGNSMAASWPDAEIRNWITSENEVKTFSSALCEFWFCTDLPQHTQHLNTNPEAENRLISECSTNDRQHSKGTLGCGNCKCGLKMWCTSKFRERKTSPMPRNSASSKRIEPPSVRLCKHEPVDFDVTVELFQQNFKWRSYIDLQCGTNLTNTSRHVRILDCYDLYLLTHYQFSVIMRSEWHVFLEIYACEQFLWKLNGVKGNSRNRLGDERFTRYL